MTQVSLIESQPQGTLRNPNERLSNRSVSGSRKSQHLKLPSSPSKLISGRLDQRSRMSGIQARVNPFNLTSSQSHCPLCRTPPPQRRPSQLKPRSLCLRVAARILSQREHKQVSQSRKPSRSCSKQRSQMRLRAPTNKSRMHSLRTHMKMISSDYK